jgi:hypothetical protein
MQRLVFSSMHDWLPKSVLALKTYSRARFLADLLAGITVGLAHLISPDGVEVWRELEG